MPPNQTGPTPVQAGPVIPQSPLPQATLTNSPIPSDPPKPSLNNLYPVININRNEKASRFYAFPIIGFLVKAIILIPVGIWIAIAALIASILTSINAFVVLFTGKYWKPAFDFNLGVLRLSIKTTFFMYGLTDKYPGFSLAIKDDFTVNLTYPEKSNRLFAIPLLGGLIRIILLIPYFIYQSIINYAGSIGVFLSSLPVLFMGKYPESTYELARDSVRINQAVFVYSSGISDKYPSFYISMNHKVIKIILIVIGILLMFGGLAGRMIPNSTPNVGTESHPRGDLVLAPQDF